MGNYAHGNEPRMRHWVVRAIRCGNAKRLCLSQARGIDRTARCDTLRGNLGKETLVEV